MKDGYELYQNLIRENPIYTALRTFGTFRCSSVSCRSDVPMYCTCRAFLVLSIGPAVHLVVGERLSVPLLKKVVKLVVNIQNLSLRKCSSNNRLVALVWCSV
jgi:hypothetical protein